MGLDVSHDAWHGAYSKFDRFRRALGAAAGGTFIEIDSVFGRWEGIAEDDPILLLLHHSDCDGSIGATEDGGQIEDLVWLAARLLELAPMLEAEDFQRRAAAFAAGCLAAKEAGEPLRFA